MANKLARFVFSVLVVSNFAFADAEKVPDWNAQTLFGDWGGTRFDLYSKSVSFEFIHKSDILANTSGGIKRGLAWMGNTEAGVKINLENCWAGMPQLPIFTITASLAVNSTAITSVALSAWITLSRAQIPTV